MSPESSPKPAAPGDTPAAPPSDRAGRLAGVDRWMASNPWNPRLMPYLVYLGLLAVSQLAASADPALIPAVSGLQLAIVGGMLWRYRRHTPEMNLKFHWSALVTGVLLLPAWLYAGWLSNAAGGPFDPVLDTHPIESMLAESPALGWTAMSLRFCTMVLLVPLFEELFIRSGCLRGFSSPQRCWTGLIQLASDLPGVGEKIAMSPAGKRANAAEPQFTAQLESIPLGRVTWFGVVISTVIFALAHHPRDWFGCVICGVVWSAMVWWLNPADRPRKQDSGGIEAPRPNYGLGPVIWSHAIINALLWGYTLWTGNWEFL